MRSLPRAWLVLILSQCPSCQSLHHTHHWLVQIIYKYNLQITSTTILVGLEPRQWTAWKLHSFLHNKNHLVHEAFVLFVSSRPLSMWTLEQTKSWHRMQILLRELSIVLKLLSEIILLKFNLGTTFNYLTIFLGVLPFCFKIFFIIFSNKTPVSGGRDTTQES